jgi:DNA repair protein RecO (recombination protein O)
MTYVRAHYAERPSQELVRLDSFEILHSPLAEPVDYARATALAFFAEVLEQTLPDHDPHDVFFRLLLSVLDQTRIDRIWMPITYFALWTTRLMGWLPDLSRCLLCGTSLAGQSAYFHFFSDGLVCDEHRQAGQNGSHGVTLTPDSQILAVRIFRSPASAFAAEAWPRTRGADLRRFAIQSLERHLERKLITAAALSRLGGS